MAEAAKHDVFVSYKREDRSRVLPLVQLLRELHLKVWFDAELAPGEAFDKEIHARLKEVGAVLVCWSKAAVESDFVRAEATFGRQRKMLVAVGLEDCELPPPFNIDHCEAMTGWNGSHEHPGWRKVLARLGVLCGRGAALVRFAEFHPTVRRSDAVAFVRDFPSDPLSPGVRRQIALSVLESSQEELRRLLGAEFAADLQLGLQGEVVELRREIEEAESELEDLSDQLIGAQAALTRAKARHRFDVAVLRAELSARTPSEVPTPGLWMFEPIVIAVRAKNAGDVERVEQWCLQQSLGFDWDGVGIEIRIGPLARMESLARKAQLLKQFESMGLETRMESVLPEELRPPILGLGVFPGRRP